MLSIIISWRDRIELQQALPSLIACIEPIDGQINIVNFAGDQQLLNQQLAEFTQHPQLKVTQISQQPFFNKAAAQNIGAKTAKYDNLFFCDCDIIVNPNQIIELCHQLNDSTGHFATLKGVKETELNSRGAGHVVSFGYELNIRTKDGRHLQIIDNEEDSETGLRQAPGLLMVKRHDFIAINGYNSQLHGWGWEDQDMISRLTLGQGLSRIQHGEALHISHDDHARIAHYPEMKDRWESRDRMFRTALSNYDQANFQGSYHQDVTALLE